MQKAYKVARWVVLAVVLLVVLLMLKSPPPVAPAQNAATAAQNAQSLETKLVELEGARQRGEGGEARLSDDEVNAMLLRSAEAEQGAAAASSAPLPPIKATQVRFLNDVVRGQFVTEVYGKDVTLTIAGRLGARDGYATFTPTEFRIGSLSVPVALVEARLQEKLALPQNRERLKLPDFVSDLRVENSELVIVERQP